MAISSLTSVPGLGQALGLARHTATSAQNMITTARDAVVDTSNNVVEYAGDKANRSMAAAHDAVTTARDTAIGTVDSVVGYAEGAVKTAVFAFAAAQVAGVVVAAITAPVPTLVGLAIMLIFEEQARSMRDGIADGISQRKETRSRDKALKLLANYGAIPRTAVIQTEGLKMVLDSQTGSVTGTIKTGMFSERELSTFSEGEIEALISSSTGDKSKILSSYLSYRRSI